MLAVFDLKAGAYGTPVFVPSIGLAEREFRDGCAPGGEGPWAKHPEDYTLYCLGEWNEEHGHVIMYEQKQLVCEGIAVKALGPKAVTA